jgi:hypothetical protein
VGNPDEEARVMYPIEKNRRTKQILIDVIFPSLGFILGIIVQVSLGHILTPLSQSDIILIVLITIAIINLIYSVIHTSLLRENADTMKRDFRETSADLTLARGKIESLVREVALEQQLVGSRIEEIAKALGLDVEFIEEVDGKTYQKMKEWVVDAHSRLLFLDFWIQTPEYLLPSLSNTQTEHSRNAFYDAIAQKVIDAVKFPGHSTEIIFTHERIIQVPKVERVSSSTSIVAGSVFKSYAVSCLRHGALFRVTTLQVPLSFIIIDDSRVIITLFTANVEENTIKRLGALFFHDRSEKKTFVRHMKSIFDEVHLSAYTISETNFGSS